MDEQKSIEEIIIASRFFIFAFFRSSEKKFRTIQEQLMKSQIDVVNSATEGPNICEIYSPDMKSLNPLLWNYLFQQWNEV